MKIFGKNRWLLLLTLLISSFAQANCKDPALRKQVVEVAKVEGVDERELLSIIAHESRCHFYVIAWNLPRRPETARSKFFDSLDEAKKWAEELIATKQYRVDVGIGQINNEAHLQPKGWVLEEVLNPTTALNRVAQVLKERGWAHYHSSNPVYAEKWQQQALAALNQALSDQKNKNWTPRMTHQTTMVMKQKKRGDLIVLNQSLQSDLFSRPKQGSEKRPWVIYGRL